MSAWKDKTIKPHQTLIEMLKDLREELIDYRTTLLEQGHVDATETEGMEEDREALRGSPPKDDTDR